ncbi:hypothetical protein D3C78_1556660 [compost metagenome]
MLNDCGNRYKRNARNTRHRNRLLIANAERYLAGSDHLVCPCLSGLNNFYLQALLLKITFISGDIKSRMIRIRRPVQHHLHLLKRLALALLPLRVLLSCCILRAAACQQDHKGDSSRRDSPSCKSNLLLFHNKCAPLSTMLLVFV